MTKAHENEPANPLPAIDGLTITDGAPTGGSGGAAPHERMWSQEIAPGSLGSPNYYQAVSDGYVLCTIVNPSSHTAGSMCRGHIRVRTGDNDDINAWVTGGNLGYYGPTWTFPYSTSNPNSCILPVFRGYTYYVGVQEMSGEDQQARAPYSFLWISMANSRSGGFVPVDKPSDPAFAPPPSPQGRESGQQERLAFIAILERLLGKPIGEAEREQLLALGPIV